MREDKFCSPELFWDKDLNFTGVAREQGGDKAPPPKWQTHFLSVLKMALNST